MNVVAVLISVFVLFVVNVADVGGNRDIFDWKSVNNLIFPALPFAFSQSENDKCRIDSVQLIDNLANLTTWAYQMWDASAKQPIGQLNGNSFNLGNFDSCLSVKAPFQTQYCLVDVTLNIPARHTHFRDKFALNFNSNGSVIDSLIYTNDRSQTRRNLAHFGLCVPRSCAFDEIQKEIQSFLRSTESKYLPLNISYDVNLTPSSCQSSETNQAIDSLTIAFCSISVLFVMIFLISTIMFWNSDKDTSKDSLWMQMLQAFSMTHNLNSLKAPRENDKKTQIFYSIKFLTLCIIIMDHKFGIVASGPLNNASFLDKMYRFALSGIVFHGDLTVDSFFLLSGLLAAYALLHNFKDEQFHPILAVVYRYIRLTPLYAFVILFYVSVMDKTGSGPLWEIMIGSERDFCKTSWWVNLLYLNNYIMDDKMCMIQTWYLPCDMHLFIIAVFVIMLLRKKQKLGLSLIYILIFVATMIVFAITLLHKQEPILFFYLDFLLDPRSHTNFRTMYIKSHTRGTPYFIGLLIGYYFYTHKHETKRLSTKKSLINAIFAAFLLSANVMSASLFYGENLALDNYVVYSFYAASNRLFWAIGLAMFIWTMAYGYIPLLSDILQSKLFVPISKLTYGAYLIHMVMEFRIVAQTKATISFDIFDIYFHLISSVGFTFFMAFILYLVLEAPIKKVLVMLLFLWFQPNTTDVKKEEA